MADDDIRNERVDNPHTTYAQFLHELREGKPDAGAVFVPRNMRTLLGGFCRFYGNQAQNEAAARFKSLYERAQLGGARAVDPAIEPVDGGGINPEAIFETGADARRAYDAIVPNALNRVELRRLEFVVIGEWGPTPYARWRGFGIDGRGVSRAKVEVRDIVDKLAVHWRLMSA